MIVRSLDVARTEEVLNLQGNYLVVWECDAAATLIFERKGVREEWPIAAINWPTIITWEDYAFGEVFLTNAKSGTATDVIRISADNIPTTRDLIAAIKELTEELRRR